MSGADTDSAYLRAPLPIRKPSSANTAPPPGPAVTAPSPDPARTLEALRGIRDKVDQVAGLLVATHDGLVLANDTETIEADSVAAMSAAAIGLAAQFTAQAKIGESRCAMFEGSSGYVCVFPVEATLLLVVFGEPDITMGLFTLAAKQALTLLRHTPLATGGPRR
ncbi:roadblock/LC7 domain-containing protein [Amycolatopsis solani]|uniref:roadblock/LC7 domain-containing protein n=1 Tax=Amycolatopsis solani TaxID=3028615 RepID=UPI0025AFC71B|nr:roadblock/LC7 domain-containing protein [Amycolatopsis sp. MEP2-6]